MSKALVIYLSKKGTTKYFGHNIASYLKEKGVDCKVLSFHDAKPQDITGYDMVLLGCWTHGLFVAFQHPEKQWQKFAQQVPPLNGSKLALFTTYKIATGSMFRNMQKALGKNGEKVQLTLKAKSEKINHEHRAALDKFLNSGL